MIFLRIAFHFFANLLQGAGDVAQANSDRMGNTILLKAVDMGHPVPFTPPSFAKKPTEEQLKKRIHCLEMREKIDCSDSPEPFLLCDEPEKLLSLAKFMINEQNPLPSPDYIRAVAAMFFSFLKAPEQTKSDPERQDSTHRGKAGICAFFPEGIGYAVGRNREFGRLRTPQRTGNRLSEEIQHDPNRLPQSRAENSLRFGADGRKRKNGVVKQTEKIPYRAVRDRLTAGYRDTPCGVQQNFALKKGLFHSPLFLAFHLCTRPVALPFASASISATVAGFMSPSTVCFRQPAAAANRTASRAFFPFRRA